MLILPERAPTVAISTPITHSSTSFLSWSFDSAFTVVCCCRPLSIVLAGIEPPVVVRILAAQQLRVHALDQLQFLERADRLAARLVRILLARVRPLVRARVGRRVVGAVDPVVDGLRRRLVHRVVYA